MKVLPDEGFVDGNAPRRVPVDDARLCAEAGRVPARHQLQRQAQCGGQLTVSIYIWTARGAHGQPGFIEGAASSDGGRVRVDADSATVCHYVCATRARMHVVCVLPARADNM